MNIFEPVKIGNIELRNKTVMPPMCMYNAENGLVNSFHGLHYSARAFSEVGLVIVESTAVIPNGRITSGDLGIWSDEHIYGLGELVLRIKKYGAAAGIQLNHAGRKCQITSNDIYSPSPIQFSEKFNTPLEMSIEDIAVVKSAFVNAAKRAVKAGFDVIEIHSAHGYLLHQFLSAETNKRNDQYGGKLENRMRLLKEIIQEVKYEIKDRAVLAVRLSAIDYADTPLTIDDTKIIIREIEPYVDLFDISSGGLIPNPRIDVFPGYQTHIASEVKKITEKPVIAVGWLNGLEDEELEKLLDEDCDLLAFGKALIKNPNYVLDLSVRTGNDNLRIQGYRDAYGI
ncbi:MAG: NADPH dehydrogenase [Tissierellales bacterium]|nr:NADPH dehydrogenase [Tissierellales bacterium]